MGCCYSTKHRRTSYYPRALSVNRSHNTIYRDMFFDDVDRPSISTYEASETLASYPGGNEASETLDDYPPLNAIQVVESSCPPNTSYEFEKEEVGEDRGRKKERLMRKALHGIPFVKRAHFHCNEEGQTMLLDDISITIPRGALPSGVTVVAEMGVALYGPFKLHNNQQPVSPILWFCFQEEVEDLLLPVEFKLSHTIADTSRVQLNLAKAGHATCDCTDTTSCSCEPAFSFEPLSDEELVDKRFTSPTFSAKESGYAYFSTKHFCFFCLEAKISKELALEKGYCLHTLIERINSSTYRILHVCTYFLKTCFDALKIMYPTGRFEHFETISFQFSGSKEPSLKINATSEDNNLAIHFESGDQILCSNVDFWGRKYALEDMKLMHEEKMYPPKVTLMVYNKSPESRTAPVTVKIWGARKKKAIVTTIVKFFSAGHSGDEPSLADGSDVHLKNKPHLAILYGELLSVASQWQDIGTLLGLDPGEFSTIKSDEDDTRSCLRGMLTLWLKQSSPPPTKSKIITVLRKLGLNEKAQILEKELT